MNFLKALVSPITNLIASWNDNQTEIKKKKIEKIIKANDHESAWEIIHAEQTQAKWTDDWFSILLSIPLVGAFIPPLVPWIISGFEALDKMPEYYQYWLAVAILSSFGIRAVKR